MDPGGNASVLDSLTVCPCFAQHNPSLLLFIQVWLLIAPISLLKDIPACMINYTVIYKQMAWLSKVKQVNAKEQAVLSPLPYQEAYLKVGSEHKPL